MKIAFKPMEFQFPKIDIFVPYNVIYDLIKHIHEDLSSQRKHFNRKTNILQRRGVGVGDWGWGQTCKKRKNKHKPTFFLDTRKSA